MAFGEHLRATVRFAVLSGLFPRGRGRQDRRRIWYRNSAGAFATVITLDRAKGNSLSRNVHRAGDGV